MIHFESPESLSTFLSRLNSSTLKRVGSLGGLNPADLRLLADMLDHLDDEPTVLRWLLFYVVPDDMPAGHI